ncbi:MAG: resolvase [Cyanobacteria bacterium]|nr:resolvase [Cyanobacteriota bacterium]
MYRYANTDPHNPHNLNLPFDPKRLNPEHRLSANEPLRFHPNEVARFARDVLGIRQVTISVQEPVQTATNRLLQDILTELQAIHQLLKERS